MDLDKDFLIKNEYVRKKTNAVYDPEFTKALKRVPWSEWFSQPNPLRCRQEYLERYHEWILASELNKIEGLETFSVRHLTNGTTQSFDEFYFKYANRRLRIFLGEYAYHARVFTNWKHLELEPLSDQDIVIISAPFCTTGDVHPKMKEVLDEAYNKSVPVLVDCAYFGTCIDFNLDVSHPAIESVNFSLTKGTGLGDIRSGIRYSNEENDLPIAQQNRFDHTILGAAKIGLYMMDNFSVDYIPKKYREIQLEVCKRADIQPTKCMHLALGDDRWQDFCIEGDYKRLGIRELIKAKRKGLI